MSSFGPLQNIRLHDRPKSTRFSDGSSSKLPSLVMTKLSIFVRIDEIFFLAWSNTKNITTLAPPMFRFCTTMFLFCVCASSQQKKQELFLFKYAKPFFCRGPLLSSSKGYLARNSNIVLRITLPFHFT